MDNTAAWSAANQFAEEIEKTYEVEGVEEVASEVEVRPMNPPYDTPEYVGPFIEDLLGCLRRLGFVHAGPRELKRKGVKAYLEERGTVVVRFRSK